MRVAHPRLTVYCVLSSVAMGCADEGYILDRSLSTSCPNVSHHQLIEGEYVSVELHLLKTPQPVVVRLAKVTWIQADRFGVEFLLIDTDERVRITRFLDEHLPLEVEFADSRSELTVTAGN